MTFFSNLGIGDANFFIDSVSMEYQHPRRVIHMLKIEVGDFWWSLLSTSYHKNSMGFIFGDCGGRSLNLGVKLLSPLFMKSEQSFPVNFGSKFCGFTNPWPIFVESKGISGAPKIL